MAEKTTNSALPPEVRRIFRKHGIRLDEVLSWKVYPSCVVVVKKSGHKLSLAVNDDPE